MKNWRRKLFWYFFNSHNWNTFDSNIIQTKLLWFFFVGVTNRLMDFKQPQQCTTLRSNKRMNATNWSKALKAFSCIAGCSLKPMTQPRNQQTKWRSLKQKGFTFLFIAIHSKGNVWEKGVEENWVNLFKCKKVGDSSYFIVTQWLGNRNRNFLWIIKK